MTVFDSSALLAFLFREPGGAKVHDSLIGGGSCSAANWAEVAQKSIAGERDWPRVRLLLLSFGLVVEPVSLADAELAAQLWSTGSNLSLADRLCLALGSRLDAEILTCDKRWSGLPGVVLVR
jgi:ribonuclease VapC